jgi:hypothetical protein
MSKTKIFSSNQRKRWKKLKEDRLRKYNTDDVIEYLFFTHTDTKRMTVLELLNLIRRSSRHQNINKKALWRFLVDLRRRQKHDQERITDIRYEAKIPSQVKLRKKRRMNPINPHREREIQQLQRRARR